MQSNNQCVDSMADTEKHHLSFSAIMNCVYGSSKYTERLENHQECMNIRVWNELGNKQLIIY